ncbi:hypothetical protein DKM44_12950 [Deinococcus irradiatisoli]|uniref:Helix-hairpin-helix DNA-binding motif class 1 domain-containing protein n=1 Tax=Deinococcus irradiatisoli TaxID=2202254 RepID=A0A2Z3JML2_9DEIO|nr:AAA family ATPase [Deinococcus irradiatisoli]AWN24029.1 hypothetical protein DKM44_12950 [Deinococcus irradiatisoli]
MILPRLTALPGIGDTLAARIIRHLGRGHEHLALQAIETDPYQLTSVPRIGFKLADRVALHLGTRLDSPRRHQSGNEYILSDDGTLPIRDFDVQRQKLDLTTRELSRIGTVEESGRVWLPEVLQAERDFAGWVSRLPTLGQQPLVRSVQITPELDHLLGELDQPQRRAVLHAVYGHNTQVMGLTGGAGTGKTAVVGGICKVARAEGLLVAVAAVAGKAADRIRESLAEKKTVAEYAGTIHKLLGYTGSAFTAGFLPYQLIILDESSMVTTMLLWEVVKRLQPGARLILVGDPGQLPPVGYGQPFSDLLTLGLPHAHLEHNYRSPHVQGIIRTANAIREGRVLKTPGDSSLNVQVASDLSDSATQLIESLKGTPLDDWQLITWRNDDVMAFNLAVQESLNPDGFPLFNFRVFGQTVDWAEVRQGDKVMVKNNAYEYGVFNGQLGQALDTREVEIVQTREAETLEDWADADADGVIREVKRVLCVRVRIGSEIVNIPADEAHELLTLGYAITVHKAQGSDWETVIIYQPGAVAFDAGRWWYTSVTRAKTRCEVLYEVKVKGDDGTPLWWANTRRRMEAGSSIFVGRVKQLLSGRLLTAVIPEDGEGWLE